MNLQPLRIEASWQIRYNQFYEVDPIPGYEHYFEGSTLLTLLNNRRLKIIDIQRRTEADLNGEFQLHVFNYVENFNSNTHEFDSDPNWEHPFLIFAAKSRLELVEKLEELMRTLPVYEDPRIMKKRGVINEPSESYRLTLKENGISSKLINKILEKGSDQIQIHTLHHKDITREIIMKFVQNGINKKVKNSASNKLNTKRFK
jgi:hypothetical protein